MTLDKEKKYFEVEMSKKSDQVTKAEEDAMIRLQSIHAREATVLKEVTALQEEARLMRHNEESVVRDKESLGVFLSRLRDSIKAVQKRYQTTPSPSYGATRQARLIFCLVFARQVQIEPPEHLDPHRLRC